MSLKNLAVKIIKKSIVLTLIVGVYICWFSVQIMFKILEKVSA